MQHFQYSRFGNPTTQMLEDRLAALEDAECCRLMATGMAAVHAALLSHLKTGDRLVAEGRVVKAGRRIVVVAADVWAETAAGRKHVAMLQGTMIPVDP